MQYLITTNTKYLLAFNQIKLHGYMFRLQGGYLCLMWAPVNSIACIYQEYATVLRTICNEINRKGK